MASCNNPIVFQQHCLMYSVLFWTSKVSQSQIMDMVSSPTCETKETQTLVQICTNFGTLNVAAAETDEHGVLQTG